MAITAQSIIRRVVETINDTTSIRWPVGELVRYLNDGQREIAMFRPDSMETTVTHTLVAGSRQQLPDNGTKLMDVVKNASTSQRAIRIANREILDAQVPNWHNMAGSVEILHYTYDPRDPKTFYVYPPAATSGSAVTLLYSALPTNIAEPAEGALYTAVTGDISVNDIFANALGDYILFRVYTKDSEYAGNAARAQFFQAAYANALGIEVKGTVGVAPNPTGNPNKPAVAA